MSVSYGTHRMLGLGFGVPRARPMGLVGCRGFAMGHPPVESAGYERCLKTAATFVTNNLSMGPVESAGY